MFARGLSQRGPALFAKGADGEYRPASDAEVLGAANYVRFQNVWRRQRSVTRMSEKLVRLLRERIEGENERRAMAAHDPD